MFKNYRNSSAGEKYKNLAEKKIQQYPLAQAVRINISQKGTV